MARSPTVPPQEAAVPEARAAEPRPETDTPETYTPGWNAYDVWRNRVLAPGAKNTRKPGRNR